MHLPSSRNIAQQTRFIYQSSVRLSHTLLLSTTTFNPLIVIECLCVTSGDQRQDGAAAVLCHTLHAPQKREREGGLQYLCTVVAPL